MDGLSIIMIIKDPLQYLILRVLVLCWSIFVYMCVPVKSFDLAHLIPSLQSL